MALMLSPSSQTIDEVLLSKAFKSYVHVSVCLHSWQQ